MGRSSGAGGLFALLALLFLSNSRKLSSSDFAQTFTSGPSPPSSFTYNQYQEFMFASDEEVEADPNSEAMALAPINGRTRTIRTVNGQIPLPGGGLAPFPTYRTGRIAVETMLQPIEEAVEEPHFQDIGTRKSVNLRLRPV